MSSRPIPIPKVDKVITILLYQLADQSKGLHGELWKMMLVSVGVSMRGQDFPSYHSWINILL